MSGNGRSYPTAEIFLASSIHVAGSRIASSESSSSLAGAPPGMRAQPSSSARGELNAPARWLIEASERAQLLVVGSHGCGWFRGKLLGSVGAAAVNRARIPVIVARQS
jgi:nucleotide-binding universal stress UspA family protein